MTAAMFAALLGWTFDGVYSTNMLPKPRESAVPIGLRAGAKSPLLVPQRAALPRTSPGSSHLSHSSAASCCAQLPLTHSILRGGASAQLKDSGMSFTLAGCTLLP